MELTQEHRSLIENIVRKNPRFGGNEDLVDDFCSEALKRSYSIFSTIGDVKSLEVYLNKVASSAILEVLKNSGRLRKTKSGYTQIQETILSQADYKTDDDGDILFDIPDPAPNFEEKVIKKEEIKAIRDIIARIDSYDPNKKYKDIFVLRYVEGQTQAEIASQFGLSQGEISKRIAELARKVNDNLI